MKPQSMRWRRDDRGTALIEMAFTLPLLLLISIGIIEFGRAFQTWQILTNAAREGARVAVLPGISDSMVTARVQEYIQAGVLDVRELIAAGVLLNGHGAKRAAFEIARTARDRVLNVADRAYPSAIRARICASPERTCANVSG